MGPGEIGSQSIVENNCCGDHSNLPCHPHNSSSLHHNYATNLKVGSGDLPILKKSSCANKETKQCSTHKKIELKREKLEETPYHIAVLCYLSYAVLILFGYLRDFFRKSGIEKNKSAVEINREGYVQLYQSFENFYTRNIYRRICDAWNVPICSVPGAVISVVNRTTIDYNWTFSYPGTTTRAVNMGSYNYLGFAEKTGPVADSVEKVLQEYRVGVGSTISEYGTNTLNIELEKLVAKFLGVESAIVFGMGFATNSTNIPSFAGKDCLILSDELNHASLILGCRLSGATIRVFRHNDMKDLERKIRKAIVEGHPRTHRVWKKIIIVLEGVYSMEGTIVDLPEVIRLKKKYRCYVYLDEAHSIGAVGPNGRGVCDLYGLNAKDIDLLMGTFTKSFGSAGGYIAGRKELIEHIKAKSFSTYYATSMSPPVTQQIISVMKVLMGEEWDNEGQQRIDRLARNTKYFRRRLKQLGFIVYGNDNSPVVPMMIYFCAKLAGFIRLALRKGVAAVGAGFPATSLTTGRVRFCVSAAHTKQMLDEALQAIDEVGYEIGVKYSTHQDNTPEIVY